MHCSSSADAQPSSAFGLASTTAAIASLFLWAAAAMADTPGFLVEKAGTVLVDGVHRLNARIAFRFSEEAIEAMENGVGVTVSVESEVLKLGRVWDRAVASVNARYLIQIHALSRQYRIKNLSTGETASFRNLEDALAALGTVEDFPLLDDHVLDEDAEYRVRLRANLEIESLPTPLRLAAYFKSAWRLSSDWLTWPLQR
jgi:hypothetical protein